MKKTALICSALLSFNATTTQTHSVSQLEKVVDKEIRKHYYSECRAAKQKGCHMYSFNKAVKLKIK